MFKSTLTILLFTLAILHSSFFIPNSAQAAPAPIPATGQSSCYDTSGNVIACAGTGQDGDKRAGIAWPNPRFADNGNGTVTDNLTGLIWLKNTNCIDTAGGIAKSNGYLTWTNALTWSNNLASGVCGLTDGSTAGQWRLPSRRELESLVNRQQANNASWLNTFGFSNVQASLYWSSSTYSYNTGFAWFVNLNDGNVYSLNKDGSGYVWPVRAGQ